MNKSDSKHSYGIDLIKILATFAIIFHHYQQIFNVNFPDGLNFNGGYFYWGYVTEIFFIISGLLISKYIYAVLDGMTFHLFIRKRLLRLLPLVCISGTCWEVLLVLNIKFTSSYIEEGAHVSLFGWLSNSLGIQGGLGGGDSNFTRS